MVYEAAVVLRENIRTQAKGSTPVSWAKAPPPLFPVTSFIFINYLNWGQPRVRTCPFNGGSSSRTNIYIYFFFQWRLRATATLSSLFPPFRSDQAKQRRNFKSSPWDRDRASASGASLRRSDAEVQVGEFNPPPLFYFFLIFFNRVSLVFIFFHCFSSAVAFSNYSRTFFYNN